LWPLLVWAQARSLTDWPPAQRALSLLVRSALFTLVALGLARPARVHDATRVSALFLADVSDSITDDDLADARAVLDQARRVQGRNDVQLVTFAARAQRVAL